jgi:hypothetical protein
MSCLSGKYEQSAARIRCGMRRLPWGDFDAEITEMAIVSQPARIVRLRFKRAG